jgi:hypothetical protein
VGPKVSLDFLEKKKSDDSSVLECDASLLGWRFPKFRTNVAPSS